MRLLFNLNERKKEIEKIEFFRLFEKFKERKLSFRQKHTNKYKLICSVIRTEILRYFRLIFVPSVIKRNRKQPNAHDQINASSICCDCNCTESFNHSTLKNASSNNVKINAPDTMTSTERCGPRLCARKRA